MNASGNNDTLAQYLIGGQLTPQQQIEGKDESADSMEQQNRSH